MEGRAKPGCRDELPLRWVGSGRAPAVSSPWAGWNLGLTRTWCRTYIWGLLGDADLLMRRIGQPEAKQVSGERLQDMVGWRDGRPRESTGPRVLVVGCPPSPGPEGRQGQCSCVEEAGRSGHMSRYIRRRPLHAVCPRSELFTEGTDGAAAQKNGWGGEDAEEQDVTGMSSSSHAAGQGNPGKAQIRRSSPNPCEPWSLGRLKQPVVKERPRLQEIKSRFN